MVRVVQKIIIFIGGRRDLTCDDQSPRVGVDGREPTEVLPDLLQVLEALVLSPHDGRHPSQGGSLQLLTPAGRKYLLYNVM